MIDTFYFGRLNIKADSEGRKKDVFELLEFGFQNKKENIIFGVYDLKRIVHPELGSVITGELIKYLEYERRETVDKDKKLTSEVIVKDAILGKSEFFLLEKSHLIAFNPFGKVISLNAFCDNFTTIIRAADDSFEIDSVIYPVVEEVEFLEFLRKMYRLEKLTITLVPSNPNHRDLWDRYDIRAKKMKLSKYKETYEAAKNQSIALDDEAEAKVAMAMDGYGTAVGKGKDESGINTTISTKKEESMVSKEVLKDITTDEKITNLKPVFDNIQERFNKGKKK